MKAKNRVTRMIIIMVFFFTGNFFSQNSRIDSLLEATKSKRVHDTTRLKSMVALAMTYQSRGQYLDANKYFTTSLELSKTIGSKEFIAGSYRDLAWISHLMQNDSVAADYYDKSLELFVYLENANGIARVLCGQAQVCFVKQDYDGALSYLERAYVISDSIGNTSSTCRILNDMTAAYLAKADYIRALDCVKRSLSLSRELGGINNTALKCAIMANMSSIYSIQGKHKEAIEYGKLSLDSATANGLRTCIRDAYNVIWPAYYRAKQFENAIENYQRWMQMRDSLINEDVKRATDRLLVEHKYEKQKSITDKEHAVTLTIAKEKQERQKVIIVIGILFLVIAILWGISTVYRLRVTRRQKSIIEEQRKVVELQHEEVQIRKQIIEEQHKDKIDSINYAKRIQTAILPSEKMFIDNDLDFFICYKPKDSVAGDFYWMEQVEDVVFIAVADSTGHGVPGAILSVVCSNALSRVVNEYGILEPGKMLDKARQLVTETFSNVGGLIQDGMDISLVAINTVTKEVQWAGANNPLLYRQNYILREIAATKQTVGYVQTPVEFATHTIQLSKGDKLYLFTDGFQDQFGGENNKKFKYANLVDIFDKFGHLSSSAMETFLTKEFTNWKGSNEQTDDVCIIGIEIK